MTNGPPLGVEHPDVSCKFSSKTPSLAQNSQTPSPELLFDVAVEGVLVRLDSGCLFYPCVRRASPL